MTRSPYPSRGPGVAIAFAAASVIGALMLWGVAEGVIMLLGALT